MKLTRTIPEREVEIEISTVSYHSTGQFTVRYVRDGVAGTTNVPIDEVYDEKQMETLNNVINRVIEKALNITIDQQKEQLIESINQIQVK